MKVQIFRILIALTGIVVTTVMYRLYDELQYIADPRSVYWLVGMLMVAFISGFLIELIPFTAKITIRWRELGVTVVAGVVVMLLHSHLMMMFLGGWTSISEALVSSSWVAPIGTVFFGILVGKSLKE